MILEVKNRIEGSFTAPKSKSISIRAAFAAFLSRKEVRIKDYPMNSDSLSALKIIQQFNGKVKWDNRDVIIKGNGIIFPEEINCGESALCLNITTALALQSNQNITLNGKKTLLSRDITPILNNLSENGVHYFCKSSRLPLTLYSSPILNSYSIHCLQSSQFATGLLFASMYNSDIKFTISNLVSKGYFEMTQSILSDFGFQTKIENDVYSLSKISDPADIYEIEGDYSGAANLMVAAAISGDVTINGLELNSLQPDRVMLAILKQVGAEVNISDNVIQVRSNELRSFKQAINDCPDLFPILCVLAAYAKGVSTISGIERLKHKETNRALVMMEELRKANIDIRQDNFTARISGGKPQGTNFSSHNDHRIAMALTILSLFASTKSTLSEPDCVKKSYPSFFEDLGL